MSRSLHDPREQMRGVHQILVSDKKRIGFLFGAGTSFATGVATISIPAVRQMTSAIATEVSASSTEFAAAVSEIRAEAEASGVEFTIESFLSSIETKRMVVGAGKLNGLDAKGFANLRSAVKSRIAAMTSVHSSMSMEDRLRIAHTDFAGWVARARRRFPAEIFTTNYDYLFEIALETAGIQYFDGFSGAFEPFFCPEAVEDLEAHPRLTKLWKLHGSLGWLLRESDKAVVRDRSGDEASMLIYPSHLKYDMSRKQPYVGLVDRLCAFLQQDDAVLFTCGYSFSDDHINERVITSLRRGGRSHVIAFYYDEFRDGEGSAHFGLAQENDRARLMASRDAWGQMSVYGRRHAVVGGRFGEWALRSEPSKDETPNVSQYFDEDAALPSTDSGEHRGDEEWKGTGRFALSDFRELSRFLSELTTPVSDRDVVGRP